MTEHYVRKHRGDKDGPTRQDELRSGPCFAERKSVCR